MVARDAARLLANYTNLSTANTLGDFTGHLSHGGERVALARPEINLTTNAHGAPVTNAASEPATCLVGPERDFQRGHCAFRADVDAAPQQP